MSVSSQVGRDRVCCPLSFCPPRQRVEAPWGGAVGAVGAVEGRKQRSDRVRFGGSGRSNDDGHGMMEQIRKQKALNHMIRISHTYTDSQPQVPPPLRRVTYINTRHTKYKSWIAKYHHSGKMGLTFLTSYP